MTSKPTYEKAIGEFNADERPAVSHRQARLQLIIEEPEGRIHADLSPFPRFHLLWPFRLRRGGRQ